MPQLQQLPGPNADMWDWQMHGTCRGVDSAVFHPDGERGRVPSAKCAPRRCAGLPGDHPVPLTRTGRRRALRHLGRTQRR